jgi:DNA-binding transcriptional ArsR family regulator
MAQPMLAGQISQPVDERYERLLRELQQARRELTDKEGELVKLRGEHARLLTAVSYLRETLGPLYTGLRAIFGQIDLISDDLPRSMSSYGTPVVSQSNPKWESWKQKFPGKAAEMIDLLLLHEEMTTQQLVAAVHVRRQTVYEIMSKLGRANLVENNGGKYRLKEI